MVRRRDEPPHPGDGRPTAVLLLAATLLHAGGHRRHLPPSAGRSGARQGRQESWTGVPNRAPAPAAGNRGLPPRPGLSARPPARCPAPVTIPPGPRAGTTPPPRRRPCYSANGAIQPARRAAHLVHGAIAPRQPLVLGASVDRAASGTFSARGDCPRPTGSHSRGPSFRAAHSRPGPSVSPFRITGWMQSSAPSWDVRNRRTSRCDG